MPNCIKCPRTFMDTSQLYEHLITIHRYPADEARRMAYGTGVGGWVEPGRPTGFGDELKAVEHQIARNKSLIQKDAPLTVPIVQQQEPRKEIKVPSEWVKVFDGYTFDLVISEKHTEDNLEKEVLRGSLRGNHGVLNRIVYDKDLTELHELQEKERYLSNKLDSFTVSDGSYLEIVKQMHVISPRIKDLKRNIQAGEFEELVLEEYYRQRLNTNEYRTWVEDFMNKVVAEAQRIKGLKREDPIPVK